MFKTAHIWVSVIPVLALFQTAHSGSLDVRQDAVQGRAVATMNDNFRRLENEKIDKKQLLNEMKTLGVISVSTATVLSELTASSATVTNTLTVGGIVPSSLIGRDARNNTPDAASVTVDGVAQAWVIINGSGGTPAINGGAANSNNVASITDNGVGDWTINFRRDMADADYAVTLGNGRVSDGVIAIPFVNSRTASGVTIKITKLDGTATDADYISVVVHGRLGVTTAN
jgi:hypothetical protein